MYMLRGARGAVLLDQSFFFFFGGVLLRFLWLEKALVREES